MNKQNPSAEPGSNKKSSLLISAPSFNQEKTKVTNEHAQSKQVKTTTTTTTKTNKKNKLKKTLPLKGSFLLTEAPPS